MKNTINLAEILGVPAMEPIDTPIKIKIEVDENHGKIFEIPVKIKKEIHTILSFEQLEDLVALRLASKSEFRQWKHFQKSFTA